MDDRIQKIVTLSDGRQIYVEESKAIKVSVSFAGPDSPKAVSEQEINVTEKQREQILKKLKANDLCYDETSGQISFTPRKSTE